jgi:hypothetical protein
MFYFVVKNPLNNFDKNTLFSVSLLVSNQFFVCPHTDLGVNGVTKTSNTFSIGIFSSSFNDQPEI